MNYGYFVYLVRIGEYVKIGTSVTPWSRVQTHCQLPWPPQWFKIIECSADSGAVEINLHDLYAANRVRGEWFDLSLEQQDEIQSDHHPLLKDHKTVARWHRRDGAIDWPRLVRAEIEYTRPIRAERYARRGLS